MNEPTIESIRRLADDQSFVRGKGYLREDRVFDATQVDDRLIGRSIGSFDVDYAMEITLGPAGVISGQCTCPRGDFCKHLVALALLRLEQPEQVVLLDRHELEIELRDREIDELVDLIVDYATEDARFGRRIATLLRGNGSESSQTEGLSMPFTALVAHYREQAEEIGPGWHTNPYHVAPELPPNVAHREDLLGLWAAAAEETGDIERAIELRHQSFDERPSIDGYVDTMEVAAKLGREDASHKRMIETASQDSFGKRVLTEIHIHRRDVDAAIDAFDQVDSYLEDELALRVATLSSKSRPDVSKRLITEIVERQISGKN